MAQDILTLLQQLARAPASYESLYLTDGYQQGLNRPEPGLFDALQAQPNEENTKSALELAKPVYRALIDMMAECLDSEPMAASILINGGYMGAGENIGMEMSVKAPPLDEILERYGTAEALGYTTTHLDSIKIKAAAKLLESTFDKIVELQGKGQASAAMVTGEQTNPWEVTPLLPLIEKLGGFDAVPDSLKDKINPDTVQALQQSIEGAADFKNSPIGKIIEDFERWEKYLRPHEVVQSVFVGSIYSDGKESPGLFGRIADAGGYAAVEKHSPGFEDRVARLWEKAVPADDQRQYDGPLPRKAPSPGTQHVP